MQIVVDDLTGIEVFNLLNEHLQDMYATSPAESVHALDISKLQAPDITFGPFGKVTNWLVVAR